MPGTILTMIGGVNTAVDVHKTIRTLVQSESTVRVADELVRLNQRARPGTC